jgi:hypothetical protein
VPHVDDLELLWTTFVHARKTLEDRVDWSRLSVVETACDEQRCYMFGAAGIYITT